MNPNALGRNVGHPISSVTFGASCSSEALASQAPAPAMPHLDRHIGVLGNRLSELHVLSGRLESIAERILGAVPESAGATESAPVGNSVIGALEHLHDGFSAAIARLGSVVERLERL